MTELTLLSAVLIGIAGSVHCVGMCGGIVGALTFTAPKGAAILPYHLAYNLGRICSYAIAGAIAGAAGSIFTHQFSQGIYWLHLISAVFLILLGLYIGDLWRGLVWLEKQGQFIWRHIQPLSKKLLPLKTPLYAFPFGMLWGWLPCGLVYSALTWSLAAGSAWQGAMLMLCFGLGTMPVLLTLGGTTNQLKQAFRANWFRKSIASILIVGGFVLLYEPLSRII